MDFTRTPCSMSSRSQVLYILLNERMSVISKADSRMKPDRFRRSMGRTLELVSDQYTLWALVAITDPPRSRRL